MEYAFWFDKYPEGVRTEIDFGRYSSLLDVLKNAVSRFANRPAFSCMGKTITFGELDELSGQFASYLLNETDLKPGDRVAVQLPNLLQFPVAVLGILRAGMVVVNTNPLYTEREMEHQFNDSGAKALVSVANFGDRVARVLPKTKIEYVIMTEIGDLLGPKRFIVNPVVRYIKKLVPDYFIKQEVPFLAALRLGKRKAWQQAKPGRNDLAVLQYTGGTTGVAKGAELTHGNLVDNMQQMRAMLIDFQDGQEIMITPLPLYHIFSFTVNCMAMMEVGACSVLIPNPRDLDAFVKELGKWKFTAITGLNTLFVALCNHEGFRALDFSALKLTISGGMALQQATAHRWEEVTGCPVAEGYGLTETSPGVAVNPVNAIQLGTIGLPVPYTDIKVIDEQGNELPLGEAGELCVRGRQVMRGYWQRPDATAETIDAAGWLKTGDIALIQPDGYIRIVDRKKDMIIVSGFNVYPNEIEDVAAAHPSVLECAAVGVHDEKSGEAVKLFVVKSDPALTEKEVIAHCREHLTPYKVPRAVEFRIELPKTNVGKILRRELRDSK